MPLLGMLLALLGGTVVAGGHCFATSGNALGEVTCKAQSYNGSFTCSFWNLWENATFHLYLRHKRQGSVVCSATKAGVPPGSVQLQLGDCLAFCADAEQEGMVLQLEMLDQFSYCSSQTTEVFLRDMVEPAPPEWLVAHSGENPRRVTLRWAPPRSWNLSSTYFPLQYHLRLTFLKNRNDKDKEIYTDSLEETKDYEDILNCAQIRCRDALNQSQWSSWSAWVHVQGTLLSQAAALCPM